MKQFREEQTSLGTKTFYTTRLTPMEFLGTKRKLIDPACNNAAKDLINFITDCKAENARNTNRD